MKTKTLFLSLFISFLFLNSCKSEAEKMAERNAVVDSTIVEFQKIYFQNAIDSVFAKNKFNGSIAVFQDSTLIYEKENGFEDFKTKEKLNQNSVFAIGSVSKQFTAVLVLIQEENGKLKTTDEVSQYLAEFQNPEYDKITIHQLLNHSSGLNDFGQKLLFKSGTDFNYSNKGYRFLGQLIEKVSGKSYEENLAELCKKARLQNTFSGKEFKGKDFAGANVGTSINSQKVEQMPQRLADEEIGIPAGGILSTINDLIQWNSKLYSGQIIGQNSLKKLTEKSSERDHPIFGKVDYGYGLMMNVNKPKSYFHSGYVKGSPSLNIYYPETKSSVVILSNVANDSQSLKQIFIPHLEVKKQIDATKIALSELRNKMIKPVEN